MEFKGTKGKWECIFTSDLKRAIRTNGGILMTFWKPMRYSNQDERYELELKETQANQLLCSKAPEMLEMLNKVCKKLKGNGFPMLQEEIEQLIKEATEI
jgi:hypothetical protein